MTQEEWNEMTNKQKHEYLSSGSIEIKKQSALRGDAKVNEPDAVITCFSAHCRDIQISHWHNSNTDAMEEAIEYINALAT